MQAGLLKVLLTVAWALSIDAAEPAIEFSPKMGWSGLQIDVQTRNMDSVTGILVNGVPASYFGTLGGSQFAVRIPTNAATGPITVTTKTGSYTSSESFVIVPAPLPANVRFSPASGLPGTQVEIAADGPPGSGINGNSLDRVTRVLFNGVEARFEPLSITFSIKATVPAGAITGPVTVVTADGSATSADIFTGLPQASLTAMRPDHGEPGTSVELLGENLDHVTAVRFGRTYVPFSRGTSLHVTVPAGASSEFITLETRYSQLRSPGVFRVEHPFDLAVSETSSVTGAGLPQTVVYSVLVSNHGTTIIPEVVVTNRLVQSNTSIADPWALLLGSNGLGSALTILSATVTQGSWKSAGNAVRFDVGDLPGGATVTAELIVQANVPGLVYHLVEGSSPSADPDRGNNRAFSATLAGDSVALDIRVLPGGNAELSWPAVPADYVLQSIDAFAGSSWMTLSTQGSENEGRRRMLDPLSAGRFYRLIRASAPGSIEPGGLPVP